MCYCYIKEKSCLLALCSETLDPVDLINYVRRRFYDPKKAKHLEMVFIYNDQFINHYIYPPADRK